MKRAEVWWAEEPEIGRRPVLILSREEAVHVLRRLVVVPATRTIRGLQTEVLLTEEDDDMPSDCVLSLDSITTIPKVLLTSRICRLRGDRMAEVCRALGIATSC